MSMKMLSADRPLAKIPHDELIRLLFTNPRNQIIANEFIARYDGFIRRTVFEALYKRKANAGYETIQLQLEDAVSETYCRLFQNDGQVLRSFKCRYENSIFAYLQTITRSVVSNHIRAYQRQNAFGRLQSLDEIAEKRPDGWPAGSSAVFHSDMTGSSTTERNSMEEAVRASLRPAFRHANVNRNFIIFKLHFLYGYRSHEIANIKGLGLSEKGIGNTANRIRRWLLNGVKEIAYAKTKSANLPA